MVRSCAVYGCLSSSRHDKDRHFYKFPTDVNRCKQWVQACDRPELANKSVETLHHYNVCDLHFQDSDRLAKRIKSFAIPTLNLSYRENPNPSKITQTEEDEYFIPQKEAISQTDISFDPSASDVTQMTQIKQESSASTCCKRNLQTKAWGKRRKSSEDVKKFVGHKEISPQLNNLIDLRYQLQQNSCSNKYQIEYKIFLLKLYVASPSAYRVMAKTLSLPSERILRHFDINIGTKLYPNVYDCFKSKLNTFKDADKYCIVCADEIPLKQNLFYQINKDKIIGFQEIHGVQSTEPAAKGFVIMARGIFSNWSQPFGYSLLAQSKNDEEVSEWVYRVILNIMNVGFKVVAFVSNQGSNFLNLATQRGITSDKPYFCINDERIYYIFDVPDLIKSLRNNLIKYDFEFVDSDGAKLTAKWEHVQRFYCQDSKRNYPLAPKLTASHINPNDFEKTKAKTAFQVFSNTVAAAMNCSIECGHLEKSATGTVKLIDLMDKTFDILNSSVLNDFNKYKNAFASKPYQIEVLDRFDYFLSTVSVLNKTKTDVTHSVKWLEGLKISIQGIKNLARDLQSDGFRVLYTGRLNQDPLDQFLGFIRQGGENCRKPTPVQFTRAFRDLFMVNMLKHPENANCSDDLDQLLMNGDDISKINRIQSMNERLRAKDSTTESLAVAVGTVDYRFDLPQRNGIVYVCGYLLKKCAYIHRCEKFSNFVQICKQEVKENIFITNKAHDNDNKTVLIDPPESFIIYVKKMDDRFKNYFQQYIPDRIGSQILKEFNGLSFTDCCECFPNEYLKKIFLRFRLFNIIQFNNRYFKDKSSKRKYFSVCDI